jgi:predicted nuclease of predicted toxin-antitoxin system
MTIYLDDNFKGRELVGRLRNAGFKVVLPADLHLDGAAAARHFEGAIRQGAIVLTKDEEDFRDLHQLVLTSRGNHPGAIWWPTQMIGYATCGQNI